MVKPKTAPNQVDANTYARHNERRASHQRQLSTAGRDIWPIPSVVDPERRESTRLSLKAYCETYQKALFVREWSEDHIKVLSRIEDSVLRGERFALAMPRGSGKTTICVTAAEWALLHGHRKFCVMIGSDSTAAAELTESIRVDFENNDLLFEDFPEVLYPIRSLDGIAHRCNGQTVQGERTQMTWTNKLIILPTVSGSKASGSMIRPTGLTSRLRGMQSRTADGASIRPDFVIIDDPQTDESARSTSQNDYRESLLAGAVLGLAGPGKEIAACMPCTVISYGDMADRILDKTRHPEWRGERTQMVTSWPVHEKLWDQYADIWVNEITNDGDGSESTQFYLDNREMMDEGFECSWPARHTAMEVSAQQHAWNLILKIGRDAFNAEYQNEPASVRAGSTIDLDAEVICRKVIDVPRQVVPESHSTLVSFIDLSDKCLWYGTCAFSNEFNGTCIEYGIWPDQNQRYSQLLTLQHTLRRKYPKTGVAGALTAGLKDLVQHLSRTWDGELGGVHHVSRILIDEGDGEHTGLVREFCRRDQHSHILMPAKGRGIKASAKPLCAGKPGKGDTFGDHWKIVRNRDQSRSVHVDTNFWKTFVARRLETQVGDTGCLTLHHATPRQHQMLADQLAVEEPVEIENLSTGNRVIEWANRFGKDNHFFDVVVGCHVGASMAGVQVAGATVKPKARRRKAVEYL